MVSLSAGDSVIVGGKVPAKGGRPNIKLSAFKACPSDYEERSATFHADEGAELSDEEDNDDQDKGEAEEKDKAQAEDDQAASELEEEEEGDEHDKGAVDDESLLSELDDNDKAILLPPMYVT